MSDGRPAELAITLDQALRHVLRSPELPHDFRTRLHSALTRAGEVDLGAARKRMERERRERLERLAAEYVRVRRSTLLTLLGAAFAAGAAVVLALPWLRAHLGVFAPLAISWGGVAVGLGITFAQPLQALLRRWSDSL